MTGTHFAETGRDERRRENNFEREKSVTQLSVFEMGPNDKTGCPDEEEQEQEEMEVGGETTRPETRPEEVESQLILADGTVFEGWAFGADKNVGAEVGNKEIQTFY